jgi:hypothetical protein
VKLKKAVKMFSEVLSNYVLQCMKYRLRVFENRALRIFGPERDKVTGSGENYRMVRLMICAPHQILFG